MMMAANLVGFAVGLDGLKGLVNSIVGSYSGQFLVLHSLAFLPLAFVHASLLIPSHLVGIVFLLAACWALFSGVQVMFEIREDEKRHGIRMKC